MGISKSQAWSAAITAILALSAGAISLTALPAQAATCPTVTPGTGVVTPAPTAGDDWTGCDLTGADLTNADLANANLTDANLASAVITAANFAGATLTGVKSGVITFNSMSPPTLPPNWEWLVGGYLGGPGADMSGADVRVQNLNGIDLAGADLSGATFNDVGGSGINFTDANLDDAIITAGIWSDDTFTGATMTGADLDGSDITDSGLSGVDLSHSSTQGTKLTGDDLSNAIMTDAEMFSARLNTDDLTGATMTGADLDTAILTGDTLTKTDLTGANLGQVNSAGLIGTPAKLPANWSDSSGFLLGPSAYLVSADMTGADLSDADLSAANLSGATLTGVTLTGTDLSGADLEAVSSGNVTVTGTPPSLPANWSLVGGYLFGPTANLLGANLTGLSFGDADLHNADLIDADLRNVNLGNANLTTADLGGVRSGGVVASAGDLPVEWSVEGGFIVGPGANLNGEDLANFSFFRDFIAGIQFAGDDLTNADFNSASLPGADLSNANLTGADLTDATLTQVSLAGTDLTGATLTGVVSGGITGMPASLPPPWQLINGFLIGPDARLEQADLSGAAISGADLFGDDLYRANVTGITWSDTICPDGTNSDSDGGSCVSDLIPPPAPHPSVKGQPGANGWYTTAVTVNWNWQQDLQSKIDSAQCPAKSTSTSQGSHIALTSSCANTAGIVGSATRNLRIDTTPPTVAVTGVAKNHVYPVGAVPVAGCATTDHTSGVAAIASVTISGTSSHGTGVFTATCAGAVDKAGNHAKPVSVRFTVAYRFGGFTAPKAKSVQARSAGRVIARFGLDGSAGRPIPASWATALAKAGRVRVTLAGPGIKPASAACAVTAKVASDFTCTIKLPAGIRTGKSAPYTITARVNAGAGFVTAPVTGKTANPETIYFRA